MCVCDIKYYAETFIMVNLQCFFFLRTVDMTFDFQIFLNICSISLG